MHEDGQTILSQFIDQRVVIQGVIDKKTDRFLNQREVRIVLLQDVFLLYEGKDIDLGHAWVQEANELDRYPNGQRIQCSCRVKQYKKYTDGLNTGGSKYIWRYSLAYPTNIVACGGIDEMPQDDEGDFPSENELESESTTTNGALALIKEVKQLAKQAGGLDQLKALIDILS